MQGDKSLGPDGYNPGLYQHFWDTCGSKFFNISVSWLEYGVFPLSLNMTNITLIPKGEMSTSIKD